MTLSTRTLRQEYAGNGSSTVFAFTDRWFGLKVFLSDDLTSVAVEQTEGADYTIPEPVGDPSASVTFVVPPPTGQTVIINSATPQTQTADYQPNTVFPAETHETALDKGVAMNQETAGQLGDDNNPSRTLHLADGFTGTYDTSIIPKASHIIQSNPANDALISVPLLSTAFTGDMLGGKVFNMADGTDPNDAVNMSQLVDKVIYFDSVSSMVAASLDINITVITQSYHVGEDSGRGQYIIKTAAQAATDGDIIDEKGGGFTLANSNVAVLLHDGNVSVEQFGAQVDPTQSGAQHNDCADYCRTTGAGLTSRAGVFYLTNVTVDFRSIRNVNYVSHLLNVSNIITIELGGDSADSQQYYTQRVYRAQLGFVGTPAIRISGSNKNRIFINEASFVQVYADNDSGSDGSQRYCTYNDITIKSCTNLEILDNLSSDTTDQYINQNTFHLDFINNFVMDGLNNQNGNVFHGGSFEGGTASIHFKIGRGNYFTNIRGENSLDVTFDIGTANNHVLVNYVSFDNGMDTADVIVDNGVSNSVKNVNSIFDDYVPICSINYASYRTAAAGGGNFVGMAALTANIPARTLAAGGFANIYTTPQFSVDSVNGFYFSATVKNKTAGGIRIVVNGYDSAGVAIASTGADVNYTTGGIGDKGFGDNNTGATNSSGQTLFYVKNQNAAYLEIQINAANSGVTFERIDFFGVATTTLGFSELSAVAMIPNV